MVANKPDICLILQTFQHNAIRAYICNFYMHAHIPFINFQSIVTRDGRSLYLLQVQNIFNFYSLPPTEEASLHQRPCTLYVRPSIYIYKAEIQI